MAESKPSLEAITPMETTEKHVVGHAEHLWNFRRHTRPPPAPPSPSSTSWQIPRSPLLREKGGASTDGGIQEQAKGRTTATTTTTAPTMATVPTVPTVKVTVEQEAEDMDEEMLNIPHVQSWGRPRR